MRRKHSSHSQKLDARSGLEGGGEAAGFVEPHVGREDELDQTGQLRGEVGIGEDRAAELGDDPPDEGVLGRCRQVVALGALPASGREVGQGGGEPVAAVCGDPGWSR